MIQRHLGTQRHNLYASPEYLQERGMPRDMEDLKNHDIVLFGEGVMPVSTVHWLSDMLNKNAIAPRTSLRVNNLYGIYRAVKAGIGIGGLPEYFLQEARDLVQVLPDLEGPPIDAYFVYPEELRNSARVAVFRDYLVREIARARSQFSVFSGSEPRRTAG